MIISQQKDQNGKNIMHPDKQNLTINYNMGMNHQNHQNQNNNYGHRNH
jgi:hypothetical protein